MFISLVLIPASQLGITASRGRVRRGRPQGVSQAPSVFDQQAFVEAVGVAAAAIAQASAASSQGGPRLSVIVT